MPVRCLRLFKIKSVKAPSEQYQPIHFGAQNFIRWAVGIIGPLISISYVVLEVAQKFVVLVVWGGLEVTIMSDGNLGCTELK